MAMSTLARRKMTSIGDQKMEVLRGTFANGDTSGSYVSGFGKVTTVFAHYVDSAKIINCSASGGTITIATQDPTATKTFDLVIIGS